MPDHLDLAFEKGWVLVVPSEVPALRELDLVQRFSSGSGWINAVVLDEDGLNCTCLGWSRRRACWHMRFVLRWNFNHGELGRFLTRLPDDEDARWCLRNSWRAWFEEHVALVPPGLARSERPPSS